MRQELCSRESAQYLRHARISSCQCDGDGDAMAAGVLEDEGVAAAEAFDGEREVSAQKTDGLLCNQSESLIDMTRPGRILPTVSMSAHAENNGLKSSKRFVFAKRTMMAILRPEKFC